MKKDRFKKQEKAKDFKKSIKRLIKELKGYKVLIIISVILSMIGAILSISAPNKLSKMTDEISKGLVVNTKKLNVLTETITNNLKMVMPKILVINNIDNSSMNFDLKNIDYNLLSDSYYKGKLISKNDKINLIKNNKISSDLKDIIFDDIVIDNITISSSQQVDFLNVLGSINNKDNKEIYNKFDEFPDSIKNIIKPNMNMDNIKKIALILLIIYVISAIFTFIQSLIMANVSNKFAKKLRSRISKKINKLPLKYFDKHQTGDVLSRITNDVDTLSSTLNQSLGSLTTSITLFLGSIFMMFYTNYIMAFTAIISSLFGFLFMGKILSKSQKYFKARQEELGNLNSSIEEVYSSLMIVKSYNGKKVSNKIFDKYNSNVYNANRKSQFLSNLMMPMMGFIGNFGYVCVCIVGAILTKNDVITFGVIVAFMTYVRLFTQPLSQMAQGLTSIQSSAASSERVFEFLDEESLEDELNKKELIKERVKGDIEFKNVTFTYSGNDKPTIKNFNAKISSGEKIAIVGPTGAGKTTMVNLLMKFYNIDKGDIVIDNMSIKDLKRENIHKLFTMVLQDTWMFDGTIKENIKFNNKNVSDEKVKEVCKIVGLHHFIKTLPEGYDTIVSENDGISSGQRQLLTIARAMINETPFLILDEATSNVDTRTEELVQEAMDKLTIDKTSFIIAHRLSTIKNADLILVMKDGNIIEQGSHNELIKKKGFYFELYNSQFEY